MWQGSKRTPIYGTSSERLSLNISSGCNGQKFWELDTNIEYVAWDGVWRTSPSGPGGTTYWGQILGTLSAQTDLDNALAGKAPTSHSHAQSDVTGLVTALAGKEPANSNIQTHVTSAHAPANAQKNSDITKAEIEAKLTGEISTHTHAGGGGGLTHGQVMQRVFLGV